MFHGGEPFALQPWDDTLGCEHCEHSLGYHYATKTAFCGAEVRVIRDYDDDDVRACSCPGYEPAEAPQRRLI